MADLLDKRGYHVKIVNIGEKMLDDSSFSVEDYVKGVDSDVFCIDLHWAVHSQGAIEIARLCKYFHPNSEILLGGLTATRFDKEILSKYPFVDAIVKGEGEDSLAELMDSKDFSKVPNLTYRKKDGIVRSNNYDKPVENLDQYSFARIDLVEPTTRVLTIDAGFEKLKAWALPICRGCTLNCATCGGSAYSYENLMKREKPAFRNPKKIVEDFQLLDEQGINSIFLFQDARIGGEEYCLNIIKELHKEKWSKIEHVTMELFYPVSNSFLKQLRRFRPADDIGLTISPESGDEKVREAQGRRYSHESLVKTAASSLNQNISIAIFFMLGLGSETHQTLEQTWRVWEELIGLNRCNKESLVAVDFGPMLILDPGSLAFDSPWKHGYNLLFKNFEDHYNGMSLPSWKQWINYETVNLTKLDLIELTFKSSEKIIQLKQKYGYSSSSDASSEMFKISLDRIILKDIDQIFVLEDQEQRERRLKELSVITRDPLLSYSYVLTHE